MFHPKHTSLTCSKLVIQRNCRPLQRLEWLKSCPFVKRNSHLSILVNNGWGQKLSPWDPIFYLGRIFLWEEVGSLTSGSGDDHRWSFDDCYPEDFNCIHKDSLSLQHIFHPPPINYHHLPSGTEPQAPISFWSSKCCLSFNHLVISLTLILRGGLLCLGTSILCSVFLLLICLVLALLID
jgi:hypothetical protein